MKKVIGMVAVLWLVGVTSALGQQADAEMQKLTDQYVAKLDAHLAHKEKEILTV